MDHMRLAHRLSLMLLVTAVMLAALVVTSLVSRQAVLIPAAQAQRADNPTTDKGGNKPASQGQDIKATNKDPITGQVVNQTSVVGYINKAYPYLAGVGGLLAVIMLIYAGYRYMTSYGDPEALADAKDIVEKALIGLALLILAAVILNTINPRTSSQLCTPGQTGCGDIDFNKADGGASQPNN